MRRQFVFAHYWWIALIAMSAGVAIFLLPEVLAPEGPLKLPQEFLDAVRASRLTILGALAASAITFSLQVQAQKLAETGLFKQLFTEFNNRYDEMNNRLEELAKRGALGKEGDRQTAVDYFNLCAEEYLFYSEGYVHDQAWRSWCRGMLWYLGREPFRTVWEEEIVSDSFYGLSLHRIERGAQLGQAKR